jgi:glycosyltransferase involved in cell wall biosynthesis
MLEQVIINQKTPTLTVIIPVFQTEAYLRKCLDSVLAQTFTELEVIIINDGSTDGSQLIIDEICSRHTNFNFIIQENKGQSSARNVGLENATGEFVTFLDSDDYLPPNAYEILVSIAIENSLDIVSGIAESFNSKRVWVNKQMSGLRNSACITSEISNFSEITHDASPCNKIIRRKLIEAEGLRFPEGIMLREDLHFVLQAYCYAKKVAILPDIIYHYRAHEPGTPISQTMLVSLKTIEDLIWVGKDLKKLLGKLRKEQCIINMQKGILNNIIYRLDRYLKKSDIEAQIQAITITADYLKEVDEQVITFFDNPHDQFFLKLIKAEKIQLAIYLATEGLDENLIALAEASGVFENPILAKGLSLAQLQKSSNLKEALEKQIDTKKTDWVVNLKNKHIYNIPGLDAVKRLTKLSVAKVVTRKIDLTKPRPWLIGERRGLSAEDTGFRFFQYCREHYPHKPIYFVTKPNTDAFREASAHGNVLEYGSYEVTSKLMTAEAIIYSDCGKDFYHHWKEIHSHLSSDLTGCFLQHGVIGLHSMGNFYSQQQMNIRNEIIDIFIASSEREKSLIVNSLGFSPEKIKVTGLSRFDRLPTSPSTEREILILPTWRLWLRYLDRASVCQSDYFMTYQKLLMSQKLHSMLDKYDVKLTFCSHFAMNTHTNVFKSIHPKIQVISSDDFILADLIKRSSMLVTDYSSVSFDFGYQRKPVIHYQFDADRFHDARGRALLDVQNELLGPVCSDENELLDTLEQLFKNDLKMDTKYSRRADHFFKFNDDQSCKRIYDEIEQTINKKKVNS